MGELSPSTMALYTAELHEAHSMLDTVEIPRESSGEYLSISQRVGMAVVALKGFRELAAAPWWSKPLAGPESYGG